MPENNILPLRAPNKRLLRTITADVVVMADGKETSDLSATERLLVGYAIAEQAAGILAENKSVTAGHRIALLCHFVSLMQREGEPAARQMAALLSGMVGCDCIAHGIPFDAGADDATDWEGVGFQ